MEVDNYAFDLTISAYRISVVVLTEYGLAWLGRLLIWEDCYYEPFPCQFPPRVAGMETSNLPFGNGERSWLSSDFQSSQLGTREEDILCSLINKMMVNNSVNIVGEG